MGVLKEHTIACNVCVPANERGLTSTMGCRRLHFRVVASRLLSANARTGRMHLSAGTGCRHSPGPTGLNRGRAGGLRMSLRLHVLASLLAFFAFAVLSVDSYAMSRPKHIVALVPRPRPTESRPKHILALVPRSRPTDLCAPAPVTTPFAMPPDALALASMNATMYPRSSRLSSLYANGRSARRPRSKDRSATRWPKSSSNG